MIAIREAQTVDFPRLIELWGEQYPHNPIHFAKLAQRIVIPAEYLKPGGLVAEYDGRIIGLGTYRWSQRLADQPIKFWIDQLNRRIPL